MNVTSNLALQEIHNIVLFLHAPAAENSPNVLAVVDAVKNGGGAFLAQNLETKEEAGAVIAAAHYSSLLRLDIEALKNAQMWQPIESAPKGIKILLLFIAGSGKHRIVMACYYPPNTLPADEDSDDEYAPEGWYEECEFGDYVHGIDGDLVGWMTVPKAIAKATGGNHED